MKIGKYEIIKTSELQKLVDNKNVYEKQNKILKKKIKGLKSELETVIKLWDIELNNTRMNK